MINWKYILVVVAGALLSAGCAAPASEEDLDEESVREAGQALCDGAVCNGSDPQDTGCYEDAVTLETTTFPEGKLELRYSSACETKWARVTREDGNYLSGAWVQTWDGTGESDTIDWVTWSFMWSNMWYAPDTPMRACAVITPCVGDCDAGTTYCTGYE